MAIGILEEWKVCAWEGPSTACLKQSRELVSRRMVKSIFAQMCRFPVWRQGKSLGLGVNDVCGFEIT